MITDKPEEKVVEYDYNDLYQDLSRFIIIETLPSSLAHIANFSLVNYNPDTKSNPSKPYTELIYSCTKALSSFIDYHANTNGCKLVSDDERPRIDHVAYTRDIKDFVTLYKKYRQAIPKFDDMFDEWLDNRNTKVEFTYNRPGAFYITGSSKGNKYTLKGVNEDK